MTLRQRPISQRGDATETLRDVELERRVRERFVQASGQLDVPTRDRLRAARRRAVQSREHKPATQRLLLPAGAFAVLALASIVIWQPVRQDALSPTESAIVAAHRNTTDADSELPPDPDSTDVDANLYQNLDFYGWLAATDSREMRR